MASSLARTCHSVSAVFRRAFGRRLRQSSEYFIPDARKYEHHNIIVVWRECECHCCRSICRCYLILVELRLRMTEYMSCSPSPPTHTRKHASLRRCKIENISAARIYRRILLVRLCDVCRKFIFIFGIAEKRRLTNYDWITGGAAGALLSSAEDMENVPANR